MRASAGLDRLAPPVARPAAAPVGVVRVIARLNIGGPAIHTVLVTAGLDGARFRTTLVTGRPGPAEGDMTAFARAHGVEPVDLAELGREISPFDDLVAFVRLVRLLRRERPRIVHTHTAKAGTLGRLAALVARVPVRVHTFHGHVFDGYFPPWKTLVFLSIERVLARFTHRILALSEAQRDDLARRLRLRDPARVAVVPLGLDLAPLGACDAERGALRAELGLPASTRLVGIVGRLVPIKNHALFLETAAALARRPGGAQLAFVVVGGGELAAALRQAARAQGLGERAHFLGWRQDLPRIYADLDVVVSTSRNEGTPVALIEAMAAGVPVVATAVGGVPDLLRGGTRGELVGPPFEALSLAAAVERALGPEARERAAAARAQILVEFGAERLCRDLEDLYTGLLSQES